METIKSFNLQYHNEECLMKSALKTIHKVFASIYRYIAPDLQLY